MLGSDNSPEKRDAPLHPALCETRFQDLVRQPQLPSRKKTPNEQPPARPVSRAERAVSLPVPYPDHTLRQICVHWPPSATGHRNRLLLCGRRCCCRLCLLTGNSQTDGLERKRKDRTRPKQDKNKHTPAAGLNYRRSFRALVHTMITLQQPFPRLCLERDEAPAVIRRSLCATRLRRH